jgi:hypothetical protein
LPSIGIGSQINIDREILVENRAYVRNKGLVGAVRVGNDQIKIGSLVAEGKSVIGGITAFGGSVLEIDQVITVAGGRAAVGHAAVIENDVYALYGVGSKLVVHVTPDPANGGGG